MLLVTPNGFIGAQTRPITIVNSSMSIDEDGKVIINGDNKAVTFQVQA